MRVPGICLLPRLGICSGLAREESGRVALCPGQLGSGFAMRDVLASVQKQTEESVKKEGGKR